MSQDQDPDPSVKHASTEGCQGAYYQLEPPQRSVLWLHVPLTRLAAQGASDSLQQKAPSLHSFDWLINKTAPPPPQEQGACSNALDIALST